MLLKSIRQLQIHFKMPNIAYWDYQLEYKPHWHLHLAQLGSWSCFLFGVIPLRSETPNWCNILCLFYVTNNACMFDVYRSLPKILQPVQSLLNFKFRKRLGKSATVFNYQLGLINNPSNKCQCDKVGRRYVNVVLGINIRTMLY